VQIQYCLANSIWLIQLHNYPSKQIQRMQQYLLQYISF